MTSSRRTIFAAVSATVLGAAFSQAAAQAPRRRPLSASDIGDIARLEMLEDTRRLDTTELGRILAAPHPELRRRAALTVARIADRRGIALLRARPLDADTAVAATTVFAVGQLRDTLTIAWFDSLLSNARTPPTVAAEAAAALGKIKTSAAREVLATYLATVKATRQTTAAIGEALLAIGRSTARGDNTPIARWTESTNEELRWRATWALYRPHDPQAITALVVQSGDPSALVRSWAVRGLTRAQADSARVGPVGEIRLRAAATKDADRRVRTEALRALGTYNDLITSDILSEALASKDSWIAVTAAEGLGRMKSVETVAQLFAATAATRPCALRVTAMHALLGFAVKEAIAAAVEIVTDTVPYCRLIALQALARDTSGTAVRIGARATVDRFLNDRVPSVRLQALQTSFTLRDAELDPAARRLARQPDLASPDATVRAGALRAMAMWADSTDLPALLNAYDRASSDTTPIAGSAAAAAIAAVQRRQGVGAARFFARFSPPANRVLRRDVGRSFGEAARAAWPAPPPVTRTLAEYRQVVERWVVPEYNGKPRPTARWDTPRGPIVVELYSGDAPLAADDFERTMESGAIVGTEFSRVVPDFVDQERTIREGNVLRDEVNRHRLTRGNLSWATAGLDTGSPGYTIGHTPMPHNEGDFTSLGRVIRGMDAADRIELGDRILGAKMLSGRTKR